MDEKKDINIKSMRLKEMFYQDETFIIKDIYSRENKLLCKICIINGLGDSDKAGELIIKPVMLYENVESAITSLSVKKMPFEDAIKELFSGDALVLLPNEENVLVIDCKGNIFRGVSEAVSETVMRGPRDGLVENILINISLIRKRLRNKNFKVQFLSLKEDDHALIAIIYLDDLVDKEVLNEVRSRINKNLSMQGINTNFVEENLSDSFLSMFRTVGTTERPDLMAFKLLEGKVGVIVDGTPIAAYAPYYFFDNFANINDQYSNYLLSSINKIWHFASFIITITLPAIYVALMTYHQELLPTQLALSITASKKGVPFPTLIEILALETAFELMTFTGIKIPSTLGTSLSIVGALILGQASVDARLLSISVVVIIASTTLTGLINPPLSTASIICRYSLILLAAILGINGIIIGLLLLFIYLMSLKTFNKNYVNRMFSYNPWTIFDTYLKIPKKIEKKVKK